ncbi:MAG: hypothetical protein ABIB79_00090 [archaeon]
MSSHCHECGVFVDSPYKGSHAIYKVSLGKRIDGNVGVSNQEHILCRVEYEYVKNSCLEDYATITDPTFLIIDTSDGYEGHSAPVDWKSEGFRFLEVDKAKEILPNSFNSLTQASERSDFYWLDFEYYRKEGVWRKV